MMVKLQWRPVKPRRLYQDSASAADHMYRSWLTCLRDTIDLPLLAVLCLLLCSKDLNGQCEGQWTGTPELSYSCVSGPFLRQDSGIGYCPKAAQATFTFAEPVSTFSFRFSGYGTVNTSKQSRMAMFLNGTKVDMANVTFVAGCQTPAGSASFINGCLVDETAGADGGLTGTVTVKAIDFGLSAIYSFGMAVSEPQSSGTVYQVIDCKISVLDLGPDRKVCKEDKIFIDLGSPQSSYLWQDGSTSQTYTISKPGKYWVRKTTGNFVESDTLNVEHIVVPKPKLGNDTVLCAGQKLTLNAAQSGATYRWQNNASGPSYVVTQAGTYWVKVAQQNCSDADTIVVNYKPLPIVNLGADTVLCLGMQLQLNVAGNNAQYLWQDNSTSADIMVTTSGKYWVRVTENGCSNSDTIAVIFHRRPLVNLGKDTTLCPGKKLLLDASNLNTKYLWQDNSTAPTYLVEQPGVFMLEAGEYPCTHRDTITVFYKPSLQPNLGPDRVLCLGFSEYLTTDIPNVLYQWQDGSVSRDLLVNKPGVYWLNVTDECNTYTDTVLVSFENCDCIFHIPSVFTPNDDALNDFFTPVFDCLTEEYEFSIYNRWGEKIFTTNKPHAGWDGTYMSEKVSAGVYVYLLNYKSPIGPKRSKMSSVTLLR